MLHSQLTRNKFFLSSLFFLVVLILILTGLFASQRPIPVSQPSPSPSTLSEEQAVSKIKNRPEVKEYLQNVPDGQVQLDHFDETTNLYLVQVFEVKNGHTATFNWYEVDKTTGQAKKMFDY